MTDHAPPRFLTHLIGWYALTTLAVGARTGLLDALVAGPGTADELTRRAGVDRRNALEWLRAMTAAEHARFDDGQFALADETAMVFGPGFPVDARAVVDFVAGTSDVLAGVVEAVRSGAGVDPATYQRAFGRAVGRMNAPTYVTALVDEWLAGVPGLRDRLVAGASIADVACGSGAAAAIMARAFPDSRVVGYDADAALTAATDLPANVELRHGDARSLGDQGQYDLVTCLDSFHHFGEPRAAAAQLRGLLRPGGVVLIAESALTGDLAEDQANPFALITFASALLYCLQENLAAGGPGVAGGDGTQWLADALEAAGFSDVTVRDSETGFRIHTATA